MMQVHYEHMGGSMLGPGLVFSKEGPTEVCKICPSSSGI